MSYFKTAKAFAKLFSDGYETDFPSLTASREGSANYAPTSKALLNLVSFLEMLSLLFILS